MRAKLRDPEPSVGVGDQKWVGEPVIVVLEPGFRDQGEASERYLNGIW